MIPKIGTELGTDMRNIINTLIDVVNGQSSALLDLVAKGQMTDDQYQKLIIVLNGLIKKGEVSVSDINLELGKIGLEYLSSELVQRLSFNAPKRVYSTLAELPRIDKTFQLECVLQLILCVGTCSLVSNHLLQLLPKYHYHIQFLPSSLQCFLDRAHILVRWLFCLFHR